VQGRFRCLVSGPALWNSLPADITFIDSLPSFVVLSQIICSCARIQAPFNTSFSIVGYKLYVLHLVTLISLEISITRPINITREVTMLLNSFYDRPTVRRPKSETESILSAAHWGYNSHWRDMNIKNRYQCIATWILSENKINYKPSHIEIVDFCLSSSFSSSTSVAIVYETVVETNS